MRVDRQSLSPLLGDDGFPSLKSPVRRLRPLLFFVLLGGVLTATTAYHSGSTSFEPLKQRITKLGELVHHGQGAVLPPVEWSEEDRALRNYTWEAPEVHPSLTQLVNTLSPAQRRVRDWIFHTRTLSLQGTGIGLGASDPPRVVEQAPPMKTHKELPRDGEGPGLYEAGSRDKYYDLVTEWQTGRRKEECEAGDWEANYTQMHKDVVSGKKEPQILEFVCHEGGYCGGYADRMLGIVTTFFYSLITNRAFFMTWEHPTPPDLIFDSPFIDWSRPFNKSSATPIQYPFNSTSMNATKYSIQAHNWDWQLDHFFPKFQNDFGEGKNASWLQLDINRGVVFRSFYYDALLPRIEELGIKFTTAYSCIMNYLFRPKPAALNFITQYTSLFSLPEVFSIGIQVRTGDGSMFYPGKDRNNVTVHQQYFDCAAQLAKRYAHPTQKIVYYLITDSNTLEEDALRVFNGTVVVSGMEQSHAELKFLGKSGAEVAQGSADGYMNTISESYIFSGTDFQILTMRSGFGKIPTWQRGKDHTTVRIFNPYLDGAMTNQVKANNGGKLPPPIDCSKPSSQVFLPSFLLSLQAVLGIVSFANLALDWSLG
ncbi:hypothetical protein JCM11641_006650 [Rhodosporidiobolus odoratus]